jgi:hypothetical protein
MKSEIRHFATKKSTLVGADEADDIYYMCIV